LRALIPHGSVDYGPKHVAVDANGVRDQMQAAYEKALAPPPAILAETFGIIYQKRTLGAPDSIAYVFEKYKIGPFTACKAYKIVEHPFSQAGGTLTTPGPPRGDPPDVGIVTIVPCNDASYTHVAPGSIATPLPRQRPNP
jgi:hypothetical protein